MYEVTAFIYDYVTETTFKKNRALMFQPIPGMVYREETTKGDNEDGRSHVWLADIITVVADFQDYEGVTSHGHVVILGNLESPTLPVHEVASWLAETGWEKTDPPIGIAFDAPPMDDFDDEDEEDTLPSEPE
jgi:hypothetical protein